MPQLIVFGGGKMGEALIGGLLSGGWAAAPSDVAVVEPVEARAEELRQRFAGLAVGETMPSGGDSVLIAVKPQHVGEVCATVAARTGVRRVLSIAAGVTIADIERWLCPSGGTASDTVAVVRAMPNTPALVGCGASAIAGGTTAGAEDLAWASSILASVGLVETVPEYQLDAVTGLSGSGPAYVFLVAEAMIEAGVLVGLPRTAARSLAVQTLLGSAKLLADTGADPAQLRADVTSPGGTTAAGLRALEARAVRSAFLEAVSAATARSRELGA